MMKDRNVTLKTFLGTAKPKRDTLDRENYWKLIGEQGTVINDDDKDNRLLILFKKNLDDYHLENHNPVKNSLWIKTTDLEFESE
jgi:hypothetical protein